VPLFGAGYVNSLEVHHYISVLVFFFVAMLAFFNNFGFLKIDSICLRVNHQLLEPHSPLEPGKIRDSNRAMLIALMKEEGYNPVDLGIASDT
jgi:hypothetical protein